MVKRVGCRDLGVDCAFEATGDSAEAVVETLLKHAVQYHGAGHP